ncbi:MAG: sugar phosphate isomerase/epimerase [Clostridiales bacterium]|nr:sugar phosphate isomerase/epimerase [Clostridiales bacterium]
MNNKVYCSTGVFIGRVNNRNYNLLKEANRKINCDGFEFMIFRDWYDELDSIIKLIKKEKITVPVVHGDKRIGDMLSEAKNEGLEECLRIWDINCRTAATLGAEKIVAHMWGVPSSDRDMDVIIENVGQLKKIAEGYGVTMLGENCCCVNHSPLIHFQEIQKKYDDFSFIIDTRAAQFHDELSSLMALDSLWNGAVKHIHVSDFNGTKGDFPSLYPILAPGMGKINWDMFFSALKKRGYNNSITLESPTMRPDFVDAEEINFNLDFIRSRL